MCCYMAKLLFKRRKAILETGAMLLFKFTLFDLILMVGFCIWINSFVLVFFIVKVIMLFFVSVVYLSIKVQFYLLICFYLLSVSICKKMFKAMFMLHMDSDIGYSQATTTTGSHLNQHPSPSVQLYIFLNIIICPWPSMENRDCPLIPAVGRPCEQGPIKFLFLLS